jgi:gamma-glutamylcyclotransferase
VSGDSTATRSRGISAQPIRSGKCAISESADSAVFGVVYELSIEQMVPLDKDKKGYVRTLVTVWIDDSQSLAQTYVAKSSLVEPRAVPYDWYKDLVVAGAKAHGLRAGYVEQIVRQTSKSDPDRARASKNRAQLS